MRQSFVSQVSCKDFVFSGKMRLSSEILAKSFVFPALFSSLLPLWLVSGERLPSRCLLTPLCTVCPLLPPSLLSSCYIWQVAMPVPAWWIKSFISIWGWMQLIGRRSLVLHVSRMEGKGRMILILLLCLSECLILCHTHSCMCPGVHTWIFIINLLLTLLLLKFGGFWSALFPSGICLSKTVSFQLHLENTEFWSNV